MYSILYFTFFFVLTFIFGIFWALSIWHIYLINDWQNILEIMQSPRAIIVRDRIAVRTISSKESILTLMLWRRKQWVSSIVTSGQMRLTVIHLCPVSPGGPSISCCCFSSGVSILAMSFSVLLFLCCSYANSYLYFKMIGFKEQFSFY